MKKAINLDEALATFPKIIEALSKECEHVTINSPNGSVVVISMATYNALIDTLELFAGPGLLTHFRDPSLET